VDNLALVEHLTPEGQTTPEKGPGEQFVKRWRVRNTGTCTWDGSYRFLFTSGNNAAARMDGRPTRIQGLVAPGATYDLEVSLVAPVDPGTYRAYWQMQNGRGTAFGERLRVSIAVPAVATATPAPTQTPVPGITFSVDRIEIKAGECVNFYWKVSNVQAVYFYREGQRWEDAGVPGEGSRVECPPVNTSYYLRVLLRDGSVETRQIRIYVEPVADAPAIVSFTVDPPSQIVLGQCVTLRWEIANPVNNVRLTANGGILWDAAPVKGTYQHCPAATGTVGYGIEATGPGGTARGQQNIDVVAGAPDDPLAQTRWQVTALYDPELGSPSVPLPSTALTVLFGTGGNLNGSSGCNTYSASYVVDGTLLSITPPLGTGIACAEPEGIMEQEDAFLSALTEVGSFRLRGTQLTLLDASGRPLMDLISFAR
jgi:heat shock protein HslJ